MVTAARYLNRELVLVLVSVTAVLLTVTVGGRFISYLQDAALGKYTADSILTILWLRLPGFLQLLLPFGYYLALVLTLSRLHAEQELEVLRAGGLGPGRLLLWLLPVTALVAVTVGYFSLYPTGSLGSYVGPVYVPLPAGSLLAMRVPNTGSGTETITAPTGPNWMDFAGEGVLGGSVCRISHRYH